LPFDFYLFGIKVEDMQKACPVRNSSTPHSCFRYARSRVVADHEKSGFFGSLSFCSSVALRGHHKFTRALDFSMLFVANI
jgi:hypothetical protein